MEGGNEVDRGVAVEAKSEAAEEGVEYGIGGAGGGVGGGVDAGAGVDIDVRVGAGANGDAESGGGCGGSEFMTAVLTLSFVAPPGHTAPEPQTVEYRMDLTASEGSQEIEVFLGEVDYNDAT